MVNCTSDYPLTHNQQRLWHIENIFPKSKINHITVSGLMNGHVNFTVLQDIIQQLIRNSEGMRLRFSLHHQSLTQYVAEVENADIPFVDFSEAEHPEDAFHTYLNSFINKEYQLLDQFLFEFVLVKVHSRMQGVLIRAHHLISDGFSMSSLLNNIWTSYEIVMERGLQEWLDQVPEEYTYLQYIEKEAAYKESKRYEKDREYWLGQYQDLPELIDWGNGHAQQSSTSLHAERISQIIDLELSERIQHFVKENNISINTFFVAITYIAVMKLYRKHDISFGIPVLNRSGKKEKSSFGMYVSTAPYRIHKAGDISFRDLVRSIAQDLMKVFTHQRYPYDQLLQDLSASLSGTEGLFQISINYYNNPLKKTTSSSSIISESYLSGEQIHPLNIIIQEFEIDGSITLDFDYKTAVLSEEEVNRLHAVFGQLVKRAVAEPEVAIGELDTITEHEGELIRSFTSRALERSDRQSQMLQEKMESYAEASPDHVALYHNGDTMSYEELNRKANQIARSITARGVQRNSIVALIVNRSMDTIAAVLGVMKAGGAFLSIDPSLPIERIQFMLDDSQTSLLICHEPVPDGLQFQGTILSLDNQEWIDEDGSNVERSAEQTDLAYIIYTSGTTGKPKGVLLEHAGINELSDFAQHYFGIGADDRVVQFASISFDSFVWELIASLSVGASLYIPTPETLNNYRKFEQFMNDNRITFATLPPSFVSYLNPECFTYLNTLLTVGAATNYLLLEKWRDKVRYYNGYGPTEATICTSLWLDDGEQWQGRAIPIGRPIDQVEVYIVDEFERMVPIGVPGELCISGNGLARGYLNRPELTLEKFVDNPYKPESRMYKTGDLAAWLPDSNIAFLGRIDQQVKLRGYRVELGEIEASLLEYDSIQESVVIVYTRNEQIDVLVAYYVSEREVDASEIRIFLQKKLPSYMIPSYYIRIDGSLPVNVNGKIDRGALPSPQEYFNVYSQGTRNQMEEQIASIWGSVLGVEAQSIGVHEQFFEVGGNSLLIIDLSTRLEQQFQISIQVSDMFNYGTIRQQAEWMKHRRSHEMSITLKSIQLPHRFFENHTEPAVYHASKPIKHIRDSISQLLTAWILSFADRNQTEISVHLIRDYDLPRLFTIELNSYSSLSDLINYVRARMDEPLPEANSNDLIKIKRIINNKKEIVPAFVVQPVQGVRLHHIYDLILDVSDEDYSIHHSELLNTYAVKDLMTKYEEILAHLCTLSVD